ncbi:hypothetical protein [Zavarzinella formosa]|uniref:hypothetical protein n=1 Tax=Zavarzinella formosa TaxID=360055 RepID=UPI0003155595|nr:hypothetical protein [Zavarzinella formosa]
MSRIFAAVIGMLFAFAAIAPAQENGRLHYGGSEYFRFFLHKHELKPLANFPEAWLEPSKTIIVCLGDASWITPDFFPNQGGIRAFIEAGGAVLIATDQKCDSRDPRSWEQIYGLRISGELLTAKADECFDGLDGRPLVKPRRHLPILVKDSPFKMLDGISADGADAIATDHPSEIQLVPAIRPGYIVTPLAGYPTSAKRIESNFAVDRSWDNFAVSVRRGGDPGRLLVVADHSVFVNGMMKFTVNNETGELSFPNANIKFTNQMIEWLKGPDGTRTRCLFVHDNNVIDQFAKQVHLPPDMNPPIPPIPPDMLANMMLRMANPMLTEFQNRIRPNSALDRWFGRESLWRWFLIAMTALFAWLIWSRLSQATRKEDRSRWVALTTLGGLLAKGSTSKRKRDDLIDTGNIYEAARWRIRDRFDRIGGQPTDDGHMPPILMADNSRQAVGLEASVRRLWMIGYGPKAIPVPIHLWDELNLDLERAVRLAGKGIWCFAANVPAK